MADEVRYGSLPFAEQIQFFRGKVNVPTQAWTDLWHEAHDVGFMVAGAYNAELLADLRGAVEREAIAGGTLAGFRRAFDDIVARHGWSYKGGRNWRTRVIFETNLRTSYAAGRFRQLTQPAMVQRRPYWRYRHSDAVEHPRPHHLAWDGLILRWDDPWWAEHFPPNGWGCQCFVEALSERDLRRLGKSGPDQAPPVERRTVTVGVRGPSPRTVDVPVGIDPGFGYTPGRFTLTEQLKSALQAGSGKLPPDLKSGLEAKIAQPQPPPPTLQEVIDEGLERLQAMAPQGKMSPIARAEAVQEKLRTALAEEVGTSTAMTVDGDPKAVALVQEASRRFPDSWTVYADGAGPLHVSHNPMGRGWAFTATAAQAGVPIQLPTGTVVPVAGEGWLEVRHQSNAVHELAHRLQALMPQLDRYFQQLHDRRTAGEPLVPLAELQPGLGYGLHELTRKDKYLDPYFGRTYPVGGALEVMTMAYQCLLGGNLEGIAWLLKGDEELAALAVGLLFRWRP